MVAMLPRAKDFTCDGMRWVAWPSVAPRDVLVRPGCEEPPLPLGPPRIFFRSAAGDFRSRLYAQASWEAVARLTDDELCAELRLAGASDDDADVQLTNTPDPSSTMTRSSRRMTR
jgi:hypothetical protein